MNDRYYAFNKGRKLGPFSLDDLLDETESGEVNYEDLCLRIGATTCERIREVLDWEDEHLLSSLKQQSNALQSIETSDDEDCEASDDIHAEEEDYTSEDDENDKNEIAEADLEWEAAEDEDYNYDEDIADEGDDSDEEPDDPEAEYFDDDDDDDDDDEPPPEYDERPPISKSRPPRDSSSILYSGHPSILSYPKSLLLVAISLASAVWLRSHFDWVLAAGPALALITFMQAQLRRYRHQFIITPKQVEAIHGWVLENSREIRIEDIGAIHIRRRGLQGLFGLASIEFATIDSPMPILVFYNIRAARRIKNLVRRLQDALEYQD